MNGNHAIGICDKALSWRGSDGLNGKGFERVEYKLINDVLAQSWT